MKTFEMLFKFYIRYRKFEKDDKTVMAGKWEIKLDQPALDNTTVSCDAMMHSWRSKAMFEATKQKSLVTLYFEVLSNNIASQIPTF